jgi:hypothetical protein
MSSSVLKSPAPYPHAWKQGLPRREVFGEIWYSDLTSTFVIKKVRFYLGFNLLYMHAFFGEMVAYLYVF